MFHHHSYSQAIGKAFQIFIKEYKEGNAFKALPGTLDQSIPGVLGSKQIRREWLQPLKVLGSGAFGKVWLANFARTSREEATQVAVKILRGGASTQSKVCGHVCVCVCVCVWCVCVCVFVCLFVSFVWLYICTCA